LIEANEIMSVRITLSAELARRLRTQAEARKLSLEQWALAILASASQRPDQPEAWIELNGRRLALIRKRYEAGLSDAEERELAALQAAAADVFEPVDRRRLAQVQSLMQEAGEAKDE
jgi:hypothetical protein